MPALVLTFLAGVLGYAALMAGGVWPENWYPCLAVIAALSMVYWAAAGRFDLAPPPGRGFRLLIVAVPAVLAVQLAPLPLAVVRALSPARAELDGAASLLAGGSSWVPLSAIPATSLSVLLTGLGCLAVLLLVRELAWRFSARPWLPALPLVLTGFLQAALGLMQAYSEGGDGIVRGTYVNRNHFAGLLEMCLPFPLAWALFALGRNRSRHVSNARPVLAACALFSLAAFLLIAVIHSNSRMGFIASLWSVGLILAVAWTARHGTLWRWAALPALLGLCAVAFIQLPTDALISHFAELSGPQEVPSDTRAQVWRETAPLIAAYPFFGCGLGAYESVMARYKTVAPMSTVDFAHNDYLQMLAEGGVTGFVPVLALAVLLVAAAARRCGLLPSASSYTALACVGSLSAILLHSFVDFNLHIPANAMVAAWVGGMAAAPEQVS